MGTSNGSPLCTVGKDTALPNNTIIV